MSIEAEIHSLADRFAGRAAKQLLIDVHDYADHREWGLALELLGDELHEHSTAVTADECDMFDEIAAKMKMPPDRFSFLRELVPASDV